MNNRLVKQWSITESLLQEAAAEIKDLSLLVAFNKFIEHNELGLALSELSEIGESISVSASYWHILKKAAEVMGLNEERKVFMQKYQAARALSSS